MKRPALVIISAAIVGKIFSVAVVHLAENSNLTSKNLRQSLSYKDSDVQTHVGTTPGNLSIAIRKPTPRAPYVLQTPPTPMTVVPIKPKVAENKPKSTDGNKDDEDRRKKRQKDLEDKASNTAKNTTPVTPPVSLPPLVPANPAPDNSDIAFAVPAKGTSANGTTVAPGPTQTAPVTTSPLGTVSTQSNSTVVANWITLMTTNPTVAAMTTLESQYSKNQISQSQFYQILDAMETSTNSESRNFSVQGAALYQNISSFKILADESQNETVSTIQTLAYQDAVKEYNNASDVSILNTAMTSGDAAEKALAAQILSGITTTASN